MPKKVNPNRGSPTLYSEELADLICSRIASNPISLPKICKLYDDMPSHESVYLWLYKHPNFADKYVVAKQNQAKIAMEGLEDLYDSIEPVYDKEGNKRLDAATVTHINNIANHKKWCAARLARKTYGKDGDVEEVKDKNAELELEMKKIRAELSEKYESEY